MLGNVPIATKIISRFGKGYAFQMYSIYSVAFPVTDKLDEPPARKPGPIANLMVNIGLYMPSKDDPSNYL